MQNLPVVVGEQYIAPQKTQLSVSRKVAKISHGNFAITNSDGQALFKLKDAIVSLRDKRTLYDASDAPVLTLHKKLMSMHATWEAFAGESNDEIFTVKKAHLTDRGGVEAYEVTVAGSKEVDYEIKGDFVHRNYNIVYRGDSVVAEVSKKLYNLSSFFFGGKNKYGVTVNGGADQAFVAAIVVIIDSIHQEDKDSKGEGSSSDSD